MKDPEYRYQSAKDVRNELRELRRDSDSGDVQTVRGSRADPGIPVGLASRRRPDRCDWYAGDARARPGRRTLPVHSGIDAWPDRFARGPALRQYVVADPNTEYLSDGITENRVVPRSRVFRYRGREVEPEKVGRELNVLAVLTGRVNTDGFLDTKTQGRGPRRRVLRVA